MESKEYFDLYREKLTDRLAELCQSQKAVGERMIKIDELEEWWHRSAPEYMADAVREINIFPAFTLAAAAYAGMATAFLWDKDWAAHQNDSYQTICGAGGFDTMDEYVTKEILGVELESDEAQRIASLLSSCAHLTMTLIEHEQIEKQTTKAFYILAHSAQAMFETGVAVELKREGYYYEKVNLGNTDKVN